MGGKRKKNKGKDNQNDNQNNKNGNKAAEQDDDEILNLLQTNQDSKLLKIIETENQNGLDPSSNNQNGELDESKEIIETSQSNFGGESQIESTLDSSVTQDKPMTSQQSKNKKKKEKKKQNKNKKELTEKIFERNVSQIKCPRDLEQMGIVAQLDDIRLRNENENGKWYHQRRQEPNSESVSSSSGDNDDNDVEDLDDYAVNGYHPAHVGEILDSKYVLLKKLGWGHFSTVWLAFKLSDKQLYALKIQKSAEKYIDSAHEEEEILDEVAKNFKDPEWQEFLRKHYRDPQLEATRDNTHNLQMFDQFFHHSLHGRHHTMAMEVLGKNLLNLIKKYDYRGVPIPIVRRLTRQLLLGLDYMHRVCGIIHTDLKPENVVFGLTEQQRFEYLYEHVLCGPLIEFFETDQPIILNQKQLKNQKKKDRKKRKKMMELQQNQTDQNGLDEQEKDDDAEDAKEEADLLKQARKTKTEIVVTEFSKKIEEVEAKYKMVPLMERKRSISVGETRPLQYENKFFEQTPEEGAKYADPQDVLTHPPKKHKRRFLRVNSQPKLQSQYQASEVMRPRTHYDVERMREQDIQVKLCDMGNACYKDNHYSDIIQTREYRSPEVILGGDYDESADIWSLACMLFELVTGDYLFDPKKGKTYRKNDDHLALISELIGPCMDRNYLETHSKCWKFYDRKKKMPKLKNIKKLQPWPLYRVLLEKYRLKDCESRSFSSFLGSMLKWKPKDRMSARDLLNHPWLKESDDYSVWMSKAHLKEFKIVNQERFPGFIQELQLKKMADEAKAMGLSEEEVEAYMKIEQEKIQQHVQQEQQKQQNQQNDGMPADPEEEIEGLEESSGSSESSPYESGQSDSSSDKESDSDEQGGDDSKANDEDDEVDGDGTGDGDGDGESGGNQIDDEAKV